MAGSSITSPRAQTRRLTADDWIRAGFAILVDGGPDGLRIGRLCEQLDVTKGSFYWHFSDMAAYRCALADAWVGLNDERRRRLENMRGSDPRKRLRAMMRTLVRPDHRALERAMRAWALTDAAVLASVQQSDSRVFGEVRQAFTDLGFGEEEAELRASVLLATGLGLLHGTAPVTHAPADMRERFLDLMLRR
ncbi:TetR/AcrR family transcriptional regulator [Mycobacterium deserti]|uniref:TetR/AcrR family transcriptional regulator n=1 Tax=Mycobacterium deserti TaxID=2978347 RepID=A0ABT2MGR9_9MYCO|nr:TetR/AcrR family transcriptional regulator [Mycobacterium deserti]MCT7661490.1 TetR/AcrR family transcriptional regulator [Mycobacterium deserti]